MANSTDKLAKELKKQMTASDERKPKPYDTQAEVLRVEDGVAWVHIPGGVDETPVRLTINAKKGDNVNLHVANGTAWITGNLTNPPTDDSTANYAVNISNEVKKDVTVLNTVVVENIEATNARFIDVEADTAKIHTLTAEKILATVGYIEDLTADSITVEDISAASGYIKDLTADSITAQDISAASGYIKDLEAENITAQDITADHATIDSLDANYAHITNGVIDNAEIDYADVNNLSTNYAQIDLANVNNAWIENGVVKDAAISDAQILGVSANKLTAGTIDASNITVTNLNASNITTGSITVDGITIDVENNEASIDGSYIEDGTITLSGLAQDVTDKIDGAIETFTGAVVPTLNNYPASSWTTTKVKDSHIGDVYYVLNADNTSDGYCYRFTKDGNTYKWVLIKDSDVTAALSRLTTAEGKISGLESFESTTSSWITDTDEELSSIKTNHTTLVGVVDKTLVETVQLWFTKANTTAPNKPTARVTTNAASKPNMWNIAVPTYNSSYPNYYYCYQWKYADGTYGWSSVTRDIAMGESQSTARTAASDASSAVSTANTASTNASNAVSTANTASTNASTALSTANTANTNASTALSTANTASTNASNAVSTANTANSNASSAVTTANAAQTTANSNIKSSVQLWFTKANTTAPSKPTAHVTTNDASKANMWNIAVPTYNASYPHYYYCYEYQKGSGEYTWSDVVYDRATTENQSNARSALSQVATKVETSTFNTLSQTVDSNTANITSLTTITENNGLTASTNITNTVNTVSQTATGNSSKISRLTQTLGTNADGTTKAGDIVHQVSQIDQDLDGVTTRVSKTEVKLAGQYATSSTAAGTAAKVATITPAVTGWTLYTGATVTVKFSTANTATTPTLNVNSTGAKTIKGYKGAALTEKEYKWAANDAITFIYDGTNWLMQSSSTEATRLSTAEASISTNAGNIALKANASDVYTKTAANALLEVKANKDTLTSEINASADTVKINANRVQIDGTATFNAIKSKTDAAYDAKGSASAAESNAKDYADGAVADKADKSNAVARTQRIYYRKTSSGAPSANKTWLATSGTGYGNWSLKVPQMTSGTTKYPYLYTAVQTQTVAQMAAGNACSCSAVLLDDTTTVIDGGTIITGTVNANAVNALSGTFDTANIPNLNASKITAGDISADRMKVNSISAINSNTGTVKIAASKVEIDGTATFNAIKSKADAAYDVKNAASAVQTNLDNLKVGGRNLIWDSDWRDVSNRWVAWGTPNTREIVAINGERFLHLVTTATSYQGYSQSGYNRNGKDDIQAGDKIVVSFTAYAKTAGQKANIGIHWRNSSGTIISQSWIPDPGVSLTTSARRYSTPVWTVPDGAVAFNIMVGQSIASAQELWISRPMMEKATKASDWSPAPEDVQGEIDAKKSVHTLMSASAGNTYANILTWTAEGYSNGWWIDVAKTPLTGIKVGDTCRVAYKVTDMNNAYVYVVGEMTSISGSTLTMTMHGLDTTIIDGGNILTNSIGANKIKANELTIGQSQVSGLSTALANTKKLYKHNVDLTSSSYNQDTWYPVLIGQCPETDASIYFKCSILNGGGTPSWSSHPSKHWACDVEVSYSVSRWGWKSDNGSYIDAYTFGQTSTNPIVLSNALSHTAYLVVYLRGGGYYPIQTSIADTPQIKTSSYTIASQTVAPTTTQPENTANFVISRREGDTKTNEAAKTATTYITHIDDNGIRIHPSNTENNSVVINSSGMEVFKGGTTSAYSVAKYGDTARIGKEGGSHLILASDSMSMSDGIKDVFNLLQKTMYMCWNRNYKGRQFANSTDRHVDSWDTNTTISTWDSIAVNYKLNNTSKTKKITSISNGVLVNDEIYVHFNYSGTIITLTYGRGSSAASSDIIKLGSAVVQYVTDEKLSQLHTGIYPNTTVSGALRIGNGTSDSNRRNLMLVDWSGTGKFKGDILAFCGADSSGGMSLTKAEENIDAFKYEDANGHVYIDAYRVGRIVSLLCIVSKTTSIAPGANLYQLNLTNAHLPKPLGTNTSGTGISGKNMIIGNIYYNKTVTPNRYEFVCRNGGSTAVQMGSTGGVGFTITYICQMDEVSGEIKYMDD